eukprot:scaffold22361_cov103-Phaeocystis_antarctica.AAC.3
MRTSPPAAALRRPAARLLRHAQRLRPLEAQRRWLGGGDLERLVRAHLSLCLGAGSETKGGGSGGSGDLADASDQQLAAHQRRGSRGRGPAPLRRTPRH